MTDWTAWFRNQLQASADGFVWAFAQIPTELHDELPPRPQYLGQWQPARHVWHVTEYERHIALPSMRQWLGDNRPANTWQDNDRAWAAVKNRSLEALTDSFLAVRQQQLNLIANFSANDWAIQKPTFWGSKPLSMVVTKTFQHTYEHGDTLLRMGLWWQEMLQRDAENSADAS